MHTGIRTAIAGMLNFVKPHWSLIAVIAAVLVGMVALTQFDTALVPSIEQLKSSCLKTVHDKQNKSEANRSHTSHLVLPRDVPKANPPSSNADAPEQQV